MTTDYFLHKGIYRHAAWIGQPFQISNIWLGGKLFTSIYKWLEIFFNLWYINESYFYKTSGRGSLIAKYQLSSNCTSSM